MPTLRDSQFCDPNSLHVVVYNYDTKKFKHVLTAKWDQADSVDPHNFCVKIPHAALASEVESVLVSSTDLIRSLYTDGVYLANEEDLERANYIIEHIEDRLDKCARLIKQEDVYLVKPEQEEVLFDISKLDFIIAKLELQQEELAKLINNLKEARQRE